LNSEGGNNMRKLIGLSTVAMLTLAGCSGSEEPIESGVVPGDTTGPEVNIDSSIPIELSYGQSIPEWKSFISGIDGVDGLININNIVVVKNVDTYVLGVQELIIEVKDSSGNATQEVILITVVDDIKPTISLKSGMETNFEVNSTIPSFENYFVITDNYVGDIDVEMSMITHDIDITTLGFYTLTVTASDTSGNIATHSIPVTISDATDPSITVSEIGKVELNDLSFDIKQFITVTDNSNQDIPSSEWVIDNPIDVSIVGWHNVTITVSDNSNNTSVLNISVEVVDSGLPVLIIEQGFNTTYNTGDIMDDILSYVVVSDNYYDSGDLDITYTTNADMNNVGTYSVIIRVEDPSGNFITETIMIVVEESIGIEFFAEANSITNTLTGLPESTGSGIGSYSNIYDTIQHSLNVNLLPKLIIDSQLPDSIIETDVNVKKLWGGNASLKGAGSFNSVTKEFDLSYQLDKGNILYETTYSDMDITLYDSNQDNINDMVKIEQTLEFDVNGIAFVVKSQSMNNVTTTIAYNIEDELVTNLNIMKVIKYNDSYLSFSDTQNSQPTWNVIIPDGSLYISPDNASNVSQVEHELWIEWMDEYMIDVTWGYNSTNVTDDFNL
jgi:hypothetical protein